MVHGGWYLRRLPEEKKNSHICDVAASSKEMLFQMEHPV